MAAKPESKLVDTIIAWVRKTHGDAWKVHGNGIQRAGEPDLDGWWPHPAGGVIHFKVECKVGDNEPTPLQRHRLRKYGEAGYTVGVVRSLEAFIDLMYEGQRLYVRQPIKPLSTEEET